MFASERGSLGVIRSTVTRAALWILGSLAYEMYARDALVYYETIATRNASVLLQLMLSEEVMRMHFLRTLSQTSSVRFAQ